MNPCTRCGKQRIVKSSHSEKVGKTSVVYTSTICPDPECQKIVEGKLKSEEATRKKLNDDREKRAQALAAKRKSIKLNS